MARLALPNTVTPSSKDWLSPTVCSLPAVQNSFHGSKLKSPFKSERFFGEIQENILLKPALFSVKNHSFVFTEWKIKTKPGFTGGSGRENAMNTQFYKPEKLQGVCVVHLILGCVWTAFLAHKNRHVSRSTEVLRRLYYFSKWNSRKVFPTPWEQLGINLCVKISDGLKKIEVFPILFRFSFPLPSIFLMPFCFFDY